MFVNRNFFGPMVSYLIIYKKTTKHNEIQEEARRIWAGMCNERKLQSNWRSPADTPSLSPTVVAGLRVRYSRHRSSPETLFFFGKFVRDRFVRDERCSWTEVPLYIVLTISISSLIYRRVFEHTLLPTRLFILMDVEHTIPYLYIQPSSRRWTLGFEICSRLQRFKIKI
jgi:hypothetical protein